MIESHRRFWAGVRLGDLARTGLWLWLRALFLLRLRLRLRVLLLLRLAPRCSLLLQLLGLRLGLGLLPLLLGEELRFVMRLGLWLFTVAVLMACPPSRLHRDSFKGRL